MYMYKVLEKRSAEARMGNAIYLSVLFLNRNPVEEGAGLRGQHSDDSLILHLPVQA